MPLLQVSILEGRPPELKEELIRALTDTAVQVLGVRAEAVRVLIQEYPSTHWGAAGQSVYQRDRKS